MAPRERPAETAANGKRAGFRLWCFRLLAVVLGPLLFVALVETVLRLAGYGWPTSLLLPSAVNGRPVLIENRKFGWRFFGPELARTPYPLVLPAVKSPGTIRVFVFGESAAYGDPQPDFGLPRVLQTLLEDRFPGVRFEVVNAAMVAINSHVILPIARECALQHGDIWVIYMGNNEVVGPFGSGTVFGPQAPPLALVRSSLALKATRTGEWLGELLRGLAGGHSGSGEWRGMLMFVEQQVRHDDPRMRRVYANFERNLRDILDTGVRHGARIVASTVVSNLKDCAPFASLHRPGLGEAQLQEWNRLYQAGVAAEQAGRPAEAIESYRLAAQVDDHYADLQFRWARCGLALGREEEARQHFVLARDYDALRFRADSRINEIIRQVASGREQEGIRFTDVRTAFAERSPHGIPGEEFLYEHVHFNFEGNYLLAVNLAEQVAPLLPDSVKARADRQRPWLSLAECARQMAWTDWNRWQTLQMVRFNVPPFTYQLDHEERSRRLEEKIQQVASALNPASLQAAVEEYRRALARTPDDWVLLKNLGRLLQKVGDFPAAAQCWQQVTNLLPQDCEAHFEIGLMLTQQGKADEAVSEFETALRLDPASAQATFVKLLHETAVELARKGQHQAAIQLYRQAIAFKPDFAEAHVNLGASLLEVGQLSEAQEHFRTAFQHRPTTPQGLIALGRACKSQGWTHEAITSFSEAVRLDPADATGQFSLGDALAAAGRFAEAQHPFAEAVRLKPDFANARLGLGIVLFNQRKDQEALAQFQEVLRLNPTNVVARQYLDAIQSGNRGR